MTPNDFIAKWRASKKAEHIDAQAHFLDLCKLLGVPDPATEDPKHEWFTFEKGASKTSGGKGWADVWRRGHFGWEYKSGGGDLSGAYRQLLNYSVALENPPLLIVSDMDRIVIHTNWTNTVQVVHTITLDDFVDAGKRDILRWAFTDPERLRPTKTRQALTEEAAQRFFDDASALPLEKDDVADLIGAARLDWSEIDPSILGTLFERGLDPDKRSQLGAHYTDRDKIMMIVGPVIVEPLLAEWEGVKAQIAEALAKASKGAAGTKAAARARELKSAFLERLAAFRVLDPACGSGNFLYLSLLALKDIEHRVNLEAEAMGLHRDLPRVGPEAVMGIELNPYAAELARVSVWIGEIQWMRRNGFEAARNPILRKLDTIENRDAVLNPDATQANWPKVDVVVGNPPFLGNKRMIAALGEPYTLSLRAAYPNVPGSADLVCYWFAQAWQMIADGQLTRAGLVSTNSIRGGANREVLKPIVASGRIFDAWSDEEWTVDGAAVRVSLVSFDGEKGGAARLDGAAVAEVFADLSSQRGGSDITSAARLGENHDVAFQGTLKVGDFDVEGDVARAWLKLPLNPNGRPNSDVLRPWANGADLTRRPSGKWIIDFGVRMTQQDAALYEVPFAHVAKNVQPVRALVRREGHRKNWWIYGEARVAMRQAIAPCARFIATPRVAKHRLFCWLDNTVMPDGRLVVIGRDDETTFGILHSRFHEVWSLALGGWHGVGNDPQYTPSLGFETFPFPAGLTPNIPAADYAADPRARKIAAAAARLNELRENWLNPADLVKRVPEVVPGYPDRILPVSPDAETELKKRTLTNLYNARPAWLDHAHRDLDEAVAEAYGWGDDWRAGLLTDDVILERLFTLNQERAAAQ